MKIAQHWSSKWPIPITFVTGATDYMAFTGRPN
jgi:hypothetical protein